MPAMEPLCYLVGIDPFKLTKKENILLETELFTRICEELKEIFREQYRDYFRLMKFTKEKEDSMLDTNVGRLIIQDILTSEEYNLNGIARYTDTPQDILSEVYAGRNQGLSAPLLRKIIELHKQVRQDLYTSITKKINSKGILS